MSVFVNELALPHVRSQQGQCVRQCRRIMKDTLNMYFVYLIFVFIFENKHHRIYIHCSIILYKQATANFSQAVGKFLTGLSEPYGLLSFP